MNRFWLPLGAAASCLPVLAVAADVAPDDTFTLGVIEVIGTREPAAAASTTVTVDEQTLRDLHRNDLSEALDLVPGLSIQNVGQRRDRLVSVRGFSSRQVPLFIDGVPVYVPYDGNVDLSRFGVDYVSKITVSKGLASVLYGPNILGGAINVVSRRPTAPLETSFSAGAETGEGNGTLETRYVASLGGLRGRWYANATASYVDSEGFELPDDFAPTAAEDGGARNNADSRDTVFSAKIGFAPDADNEYALSFYRQDGDKNVPPYAGTATGVAPRYWQWPYWDKQSVYFTARNGVTEQGTLRYRVYFDQFKNALDSFDNATYSSFNAGYAFEGSEYDDYTFGGNTDVEWRWNSQHATRTALHWKQDIHREIDEVDSPEERYEDESYAIALEHEWRLTETVTLTPGYAYTVQDGQQAENVVGGVIVPQAVDRADAHNAQLVATWKTTKNGSFDAGISRKTRFPTIKDRFSFRLGSAIANPDLGPETAVHYELGWTQLGEQWELRAAIFQSDIDDAIESVTIPATACTAPNPNCFQQQNIGKQRNRGFEVSFGLTPVKSVKTDLQLSVVDRDNRSRPDIRLTDTPEQKYRAAIAWTPSPMWSWRTDAQYETKRYSATTVRNVNTGVVTRRVADSHTLLNSFVRFSPLPEIGFELGGRNLTDQRYAYQEGFFESGRTWLAQVDYRY